MENNEIVKVKAWTPEHGIFTMFEFVRDEKNDLVREDGTVLWSYEERISKTKTFVPGFMISDFDKKLSQDYWQHDIWYSIEGVEYRPLGYWDGEEMTDKVILGKNCKRV